MHSKRSGITQRRVSLLLRRCLAYRMKPLDPKATRPLNIEDSSAELSWQGQFNREGFADDSVCIRPVGQTLDIRSSSLCRPASKISSTGQSGVARSEHCATVSAKMDSSLTRSESLLRTLARCALAILCTSAHEARSGPPRSLSE